MLIISRHHDTTLFAVNGAELALIFMQYEVFLGHLDFTPIIGTLDGGVVTLRLMLFEVSIGYDCGTAFIGTFTGALK